MLVGGQRHTPAALPPGKKPGRVRLKRDGTRAETRFRLSAKRTSPFKSAGASVQSTTGSRDLGISGSNAGYTMFRGSVKSTGYPLHSPVSPSLHFPCVTVCHQVSNALYSLYRRLSGSQGLSGRAWKISPPPGFDPGTVQSVANELSRPDMDNVYWCLSYVHIFMQSTFR
jgi:hypothetical protein